MPSRAKVINKKTNKVWIEKPKIGWKYLSIGKQNAKILKYENEIFKPNQRKQ